MQKYETILLHYYVIEKFNIVFNQTLLIDFGISRLIKRIEKRFIYIFIYEKQELQLIFNFQISSVNQCLNKLYNKKNKLIFKLFFKKHKYFHHLVSIKVFPLKKKFF